MQGERKLKRFFALAAAIFFTVTTFFGCSSKVNDEKKGVSVVCTLFAQYDWAKNITEGTDASVVLLSENGADIHSFSPSARDIVKIAASDLMIYNGGVSDEWVKKVLATTAKDTDSIAITEVTDYFEEELKEGMQEEHSLFEHEEEYDEHVWLSLNNAEKACEKICSVLCEKDEKNADIYKKNTQTYLEKIQNLKDEYEKLFKGKRKAAAVFLGKFPYRYMLREFDIDYYAAFPGCSSETEASFETIAFLSKKIDELKADIVLLDKTDDEAVARSVIKNTKAQNAKILYMDSMQSANKEYVAENSYLGIMENNLKSLYEAVK